MEELKEVTEEASVELLLAGGSSHATPTLDFAEEAPVESVPAVSVEMPVAIVKAPLPQADVPTGFVWPAHTGRAMLQALAVYSDRRKQHCKTDQAVK